MIAAAHRAQGLPVPETCFAPELSDDLLFAYRAFYELTTDRAVGFAVGPIPFAAIDAYARRYGVDDRDEFDRLRDLVRAADEAYLAEMTRRAETKK